MGMVVVNASISTERCVLRAAAAAAAAAAMIERTGSKAARRCLFYNPCGKDRPLPRIVSRRRS
jgi:hypothetical protein